MRVWLQLHEVEERLERVLEAIAERDLAPSIAAIQKYFAGKEQQNAMAALEVLIIRCTVKLGSVVGEYNDLTHFLACDSSYLAPTSGKSRVGADEVGPTLIRDLTGTRVSGMPVDGREAYSSTSAW